MKPVLKRVTKESEVPYVSVYSLDYETKSGKDKRYTIISRNELNEQNINVIKTNAITAFVLNHDHSKVLLLKEFRMGANAELYNTVSGLIDEGETAFEALEREMKEEVGLSITKVNKEFPASFSSIGITDETVIPFIVEVKEGEINQQLSDDEYITPEWMDKQEVNDLLQTSQLGARTQLFGYMFVSGMFD